MNLDELQSLVDMVQNSQLREITLKQGDRRLTIRRDPQLGATQTLSDLEMMSEASLLGSQELTTTVHAPEAVSYQDVSAPYVGVFCHLRPMVGMGSRITNGQTLCTIQSMDIHNEVVVEVDGQVIDIHVEDNQPVEFGQILYTIEVNSSPNV